tara:strand:- start:209 stop:406 length:198 start_codon:yes stop_codon:yes gene_type:complete
MSSFESRFYLKNPTLLQSIRRNIVLLADSLVFLFIWMTKGRQLRKALREAETVKHTLYLEDHLGE